MPDGHTDVGPSLRENRDRPHQRSLHAARSFHDEHATPARRDDAAGALSATRRAQRPVARPHPAPAACTREWPQQQQHGGLLQPFQAAVRAHLYMQLPASMAAAGAMRAPPGPSTPATGAGKKRAVSDARRQALRRRDRAVSRATRPSSSTRRRRASTRCSRPHDVARLRQVRANRADIRAPDRV